MKIKCDICGGELVMLPGGKGGACKNCGMEHSVERIREMLGIAEQETEKKPVKKATPKKELARKAVTPPAPEEEPEILDVEDIEVIEDVEIVEEIEEERELTETSESDFVIKKKFGGKLLVEYNGHAQRVIFPNDCVEIKDKNMFTGRDEIVELVFSGFYPDTMAWLEGECFKGLKNLERIVCERDFTVGASDFKDCKKLKSVTVKNASIIFLQQECFANCTSLERVDLNENIELDIYRGAFKNCTSLKEFIHPKNSGFFDYGCVGIESTTFEGCTSLRRVVLANDTVAIHKDAFKDCTSLESVTTHSGGLDGIAIHPDAFRGSSFQPENAGICPKCGKKLDCTDNEISCSCGFSSRQYDE
ncbi:MAG: leucine-rich repeat domain-containing protein [Clostridia bacterium]|nr:leucine-rich repeat domain-containing protein [Clostridia bacterium]